MDFPEVGTPPPHCNCNSITAFNLVLRKRQLDRLQSPIHHPCPSTHARQVGSIRGSCYSAVYTVYVEISVNAVNCLISNYCKNRGWWILPRDLQHTWCHRFWTWRHIHIISPATEEARVFANLQAIKNWRQKKPGNEASETVRGEEIKLWQKQKPNYSPFCLCCA